MLCSRQIQVPRYYNYRYEFTYLRTVPKLTHTFLISVPRYLFLCTGIYIRYILILDDTFLTRQLWKDGIIQCLISWMITCIQSCLLWCMLKKLEMIMTKWFIRTLSPFVSNFIFNKRKSNGNWTKLYAGNTFKVHLRYRTICT